MTNSIEELQDAKVLFVIGSNTTEAHPIISYYMKRAVKRGAILIVNDPRKTDLTRWATLHVQHKVGTDIAYINGLINEIFKNADKIQMTVEETQKGVKVTETSKDEKVVVLIQEHSKIIDNFVATGWDSAHEEHPVPAKAKGEK